MNFNCLILIKYSQVLYQNALISLFQILAVQMLIYILIILIWLDP